MFVVARRHLDRNFAFERLGPTCSCEITRHAAAVEPLVPPCRVDSRQVLGGQYLRVMQRASPLLAPNRAEVEARISELQQLIEGGKRANANPRSGVLRAGPVDRARPPD